MPSWAVYVQHWYTKYGAGFPALRELRVFIINAIRKPSTKALVFGYRAPFAFNVLALVQALLTYEHRQKFFHEILGYAT